MKAEAEQRCQASFGPVSLLVVLASPAKEKRLGCQADFGLVSPPDDLMSHDIADKGPQQIESAAPVAYGVTASFGPASPVVVLVSPLDWCGIADKDPQQIESAAHVAYGVVANLEVSIFYVGRRM